MKICPYCGRHFFNKMCKPLVPKHSIALIRQHDDYPFGCTWEVMTPMICPGSNQHPLKPESDKINVD